MIASVFGWLRARRRKTARLRSRPGSFGIIAPYYLNGHKAGVSWGLHDADLACPASNGKDAAGSAQLGCADRGRAPELYQFAAVCPDRRQYVGKPR